MAGNISEMIKSLLNTMFFNIMMILFNKGAKLLNLLSRSIGGNLFIEIHVIKEKEDSSI